MECLIRMAYWYFNVKITVNSERAGTHLHEKRFVISEKKMQFASV
jgi:hypothetical protein